MICYDVIFYFANQQQKASAVWQLFVLDQDLEILNTSTDDQGNIVPPTDWHPRWKVETQCPVDPDSESEEEMWAARIPARYYRKILAANITGFEILVAGYPSDDPESLLRHEVLAFHCYKYDAMGDEIIEEIDLSLQDESGNLIDHRIAPTQAACDIYARIYPQEITVKDPDGNDITIQRGNFANHGDYL